MSHEQSGMSFALHGMNTFSRYDPQVEKFRQSFYQKPRVLQIKHGKECFEVRQPAKRNFHEKRSQIMLWTLFVVLLIMWLVEVVSSHTLGGFMHILMILATATVLISVIQGRKAL